MMDKRTKEYLIKISLQMPSTLKKALMRIEKVNGSEELMERILSQKKDLKKEEKEAIEAGLREGKYAGKNQFVNDPKVAKAANEYFETKIKQGIKNGDIKEFQGDSFTRMLQAKYRT